jgi:hypothetical protein
LSTTCQARYNDYKHIEEKPGKGNIMDLSDDSVRQAATLAREGRTEEARAALIDLVRADGENVEAWAVLAQLVETPKDAAYCLEQVLRIQPDNEWAMASLQQLWQAQPVADGPEQTVDEVDNPASQVEQDKANRFPLLRSKVFLGGAGVIAILLLVILAIVLFSAIRGRLAASPSSPADGMSMPTLLPLATPTPRPQGVTPPPAEYTMLPAASTSAGPTATQEPGKTSTVAPTDANAGQVLTSTPSASPIPTETPAFTPTDYPTPTDPPEPQDVPTNAPPPAIGPCNCYGASLTCKDFNTQAEAQACYTFCLDETGIDIFFLDTNNNNVACEDLP